LRCKYITAALPPSLLALWFVLCLVSRRLTWATRKPHIHLDSPPGWQPRDWSDHRPPGHMTWVVSVSSCIARPNRDRMGCRSVAAERPTCPQTGSDEAAEKCEGEGRTGARWVLVGQSGWLAVRRNMAMVLACHAAPALVRFASCRADVLVVMTAASIGHEGTKELARHRASVPMLGPWTRNPALRPWSRSQAHHPGGW